MMRFLVVGILVAGGAAAGTAWMGDLQPLEVRVVSMADPMLTDRITELVVEVHNPGPETAWPNFAVPANSLKNWYPWSIEEGPTPLQPGETGVYRLTSPPYTGVAIEEGFRVLVNDLHHGNIRGSSAVMRPVVTWDLPAVLNPTFQAWEPSMFHATPLPYGWVHWYERHGGDRGSIEGKDGEITLRLEPDRSRTTGDEWSLVSVRQRIDFPTTLRVELVDATRGAFSAGARTQAGVLLEDVYGGTQVVILFAGHATDADQEAVHDLVLDDGNMRSYRVLVTNRSIEIDLVKLYRDHGWHLPARQELPRLVPHGPGDVGMGHASVLAGLQRAEVARPMELKVFVASYVPHELDAVEATFAFVGGPAYEPAASRLNAPPAALPSPA